MLAEWNTNSMAQSQALFDGVMKQSRCADVACLTQMNATDLVAAATKAFASDGTAHWGPTVDGVDTIDSPFKLTKKGHLHNGPLLLGTARDGKYQNTSDPTVACDDVAKIMLVITETCSLEGRDWSFGLTQAAFEADTTSEYGSLGINVSKMVGLYGGSTRPSTTRSRRPVSEWWWAAIERSSDFSFHCPSRYAARQVASKGQPTFLFSYNVSLEMWAHWGGVQCVPHCAELGGLFFAEPPDPKTPQGQLTETMVRYLLRELASNPPLPLCFRSNDETTISRSRYFTSFARTGDPNTEKATGAPEWPAFNPTSGGGGENMIFALPAVGGARAEAGYRGAQCDYWETLPGGPDGAQ